MRKVFISYSRKDGELVDKIVEEMEKAGLDVWLDREAIRAGNTWKVQIVEGIESCLAFVLMLSPNSAVSKYVRTEIDLAQETEHPFLPLMLEPVSVIPREIRFQLAGQQFIDLKMLGFEKAVKQLIETLKEHIKEISATVEHTTRQAELVIQGIKLEDITEEKKGQLLDFLAQLTNSDRSQLQLANLAPGSVHAFVDMPAHSAYKLKTLALNRDKRFKEFGITSMRLDGDTKYVNIALGILTVTATLSLFQSIWLRIPPLFQSVFGAMVGKILTVVLPVILVAGAGVAIAQSGILSTPEPEPIIIATDTQIPIPVASPTEQAIGTLSSTSTPTSTATATPTLTPTFTPEPVDTETPLPTYEILRGVVRVERLACRHGPDSVYLFQDGYIQGLPVTINGRDDTGKWLYVLGLDYLRPCWVTADGIKVSGDIANLEPVYPDKAPLISFQHPQFSPPQNVEAMRQGNQVTITWTGYPLADGDRESPNSPVYLVEAWACQGGEIVFTPIGAYDERAVIDDETGCSAPSHGRVFLAHKRGYVGPVEIPWPE